jgi:hypothetical protein
MKCLQIVEVFETWIKICILLIVFRDIVLDFLGISETGRRDYSTSLLNRLSGGDDFTWFFRPRRGLSSVLLLGVRAYTMHVLAISGGDFLIKLHIRKADNLMWSRVAMNGIAKH